MQQKITDNPHFHLWIPDLFNARGGIQIYSSFLFQAVQNIYPDATYDIFIKHDTHIADDFKREKLNFYPTGNIPLKFRTLIFAFKLLTMGCLKRPNLIISTHINFIIVADWLKRIAHIPYGVVAHGIEVWNLENPNLQQALKNADRIVAVSNYTRDRLLHEQNISPEQIIVLPNTFDSDRFQIAAKPDYLLKRYKLTPDQPIILTVGRLSSQEQYKGYDKIILSLPEIIKIIPNIHYILVGKGDDIIRIEQLIKKLNLENHVTLTGFIPDDELCHHYNLCDVFAMPSKGEGFGIVYLEALSCGKPTLGGNQDAAIDALCHGKLGVLVNPDNLEEITTNLIKIITGKHDNKLIYQPQQLRQKVIDIYGFSQFQKTLANHLKNYF
jgi:glycosyltransferase involved in cell wall biosynthesis